eukprot:8835449-Karenia_brevis.AAC.1
MMQASTAAQSAEFVQRMNSFVDHLQRSNHFKQDQHAKQEHVFEAASESGHDEAVFPFLHHLCTKP